TVTGDFAWIGLEERDALVMRSREDVVRRGPAFVTLVALEERRVDDPEEVPVALAARLGDEPELLGEVHAKVRHDGMNPRGRTELKEDHIARLGPDRLIDREPIRVGHRFGER